MEEGEIGGLREATPENGIINGSEIERRNQELLPLLLRIGIGGTQSQLDLSTHLGTLILVNKLDLHFLNFHIKSNPTKVQFKRKEIVMEICGGGWENKREFHNYIYIERDWDKREYSFGCFVCLFGCVVQRWLFKEMKVEKG